MSTALADVVKALLALPTSTMGDLLVSGALVVMLITGVGMVVVAVGGIVGGIVRGVRADVLLMRGVGRQLLRYLRGVRAR